MAPAQSHSTPVTLYCHGLPGSAAEIAALIPNGATRPITLGPLDFDGFASALQSHPKAPIHLIGFSLGAMTALRFAGAHPDRVTRLTLISPAAPLDLGDFLPDMAGKAVFRAAQKGRTYLRVLTALQRMAFTIAPKPMIKMLFASSPAADRDLLHSPDFVLALTHGLKTAYGPHRDSYLAALSAYVSPWADTLSDVTCPVTLHHGTEDDWAPIAMSHALAHHLPGESELIPHPGLGHYATLHHVLPALLAI